MVCKKVESSLGMVCDVTPEVYWDACLTPRNVWKSSISAFSLEVELLDCVTVHSQSNFK